MSAPAPAPATKSKPPTPPLAVKLAVAAVAAVFLLLMIILSAYLAGPAGKANGFFNTRATLGADFNLIAEIVLLVGLMVGYVFALSKHVSAHQYNQTTWVLFNIVLVIFIMIGSYATQVVPGMPANLLKARTIVSTIHALLGTITIVCALYILLRMNGLLPKPLRVKWWKNLMRFTLGMYLLVGFFGLGTYVVWYVIPLAKTDTTQNPQPTPAAGSVVLPLANYTFNPGTLEIPAGTTVIFHNSDPDRHTITSETAAFPEGQVDEGQDYKFKFDTVGDFPYFCQFHGAKGGVGMAGVIKVVAASASLVLPTAVVPAKPTPQPTPAAPPEVALGPQAVGYGAFRDVSAHNDGFDLKVAGLPAPTGQFFAWLTGGAQPLLLGTLTPDANGAAQLSYVDPNGANLLGQYSGFSITAEAAGAAPKTPSTTVLITNTLPAGVLSSVRKLLVSSTDAPKNKPYAVGLVAMVEELVRHAKAVNGAAGLGDSPSMDRHIEHMLNILEGRGGPDYKDFNGDGILQDPGDGFGIDHYVDAIGAQAAAAAGAPDATDNIKTHAAELAALAINLRAWANQDVDLLLRAHAAAAAADKQALTTQALILTRSMLNGVDTNGNGKIDPLEREGGAYTTYFYSQYLAALGALPEPGSGVATAVPPTVTVTAGPTETPGGPTATATPAPTDTAVPVVTPKPVIVTYSNFVITPAEITIKVGTTITFVTRDTLHEPYSTSGPAVFDSGPGLPPGSTYKFTFNKAGTVTLLCGYHNNMQATLTITP